MCACVCVCEYAFVPSVFLTKKSQRFVRIGHTFIHPPHIQIIRVCTVQASVLLSEGETSNHATQYANQTGLDLIFEKLMQVEKRYKYTHNARTLINQYKIHTSTHTNTSSCTFVTMCLYLLLLLYLTYTPSLSPSLLLCLSVTGEML